MQVPSIAYYISSIGMRGGNKEVERLKVEKAPGFDVQMLKNYKTIWGVDTVDMYLSMGAGQGSTHLGGPLLCHCTQKKIEEITIIGIGNKACLVCQKRYQ